VLRDEQLERLSGAPFDVLVIGAGAVGAATAWYASLAGARVAVVDRGDVAGATSSASSKLMHGGLRYLAMGDVGLVREAHHERRIHARTVAPNLVRPLDFVVPVGESATLNQGRWSNAEADEIIAAMESTDDEAELKELGLRMQELVVDLTAALRVLTNNTFEQFAHVEYANVPAGSRASIVRQKQIVVGRYRGVRSLTHTLGFGGRRTRPDGTIFGAAVVLDSEFDRTSEMRRLLRTHELGHALGYNHVESRASIMNPRIGAEMTDFDRQIVRAAFQDQAEKVSQ